MLYPFWENWLLYHKVTFDGENRLIYIAEGVSSITIKSDVYSSWKEWLSINYNSKYLPALTSVGGQPLPGGGLLGDTYFLINGWKIYLERSVSIAGNLYTDDATSAFVIPQDVYIAQSTVSQLVQTVQSDATNISNQVWNDAPTNEIATAVWNVTINDKTTANTTGNKLRQDLTRNQFIALK